MRRRSWRRIYDATDRQWVAAARRLLPALREDTPTGIIRSFAQMADGHVAATYVTALLLRVGSVLSESKRKDIRSGIARSIFGPKLVDADSLIGRIFKFGHASYSILTELSA
jgi:hypothetical protein